MKKGVCLLAALFLISLSCFALTEGISGELSFGEGEEAVSLRFSLARENQNMTFYSSFCPGWIFQAKTGFILPALLPAQTDEGMNSQLLQVWESWAAVTGLETKTGVFTGDMFESTAEMKQLTFSWSDLTMLLDILDLQNRPSSPDAGWNETVSSLRKILPEIAMQHPGIRFQLNLFEEARTLSLTVIDGSDTIGTFSVRREDDGKLRMVLGSAEAGKTYFRTIEMTAEAGKKLSVSASALADDQGCGYSGLNEKNLVLREKLEVNLSSSETVSFRYVSEKGGTGECLLSANGTLCAEEDGSHLLNAEFFFGEDAQRFGSLRLTDDLSMAEQPPQEARTLDCLNPDPESLEILTQEINELFSDWMIRLMRVLPAEMVLLLLS